MNDATRKMIQVEGLESRTLMSFGGFGGFPRFIPQPPSDAVKADLATIKTDQQKLATDHQTLAPTLEADRQAIADAIKALDTQLTPLRDELKKDAQTWRMTLLADLKAFATDRGDADKLAADRAKLKADQTAARTELQSDAKAIRDLIDNNTAVKDARAKLATDSKPITDDLAKLRADYEQLAKDVRAQRDGSGTTTTTA